MLYEECRPNTPEQFIGPARKVAHDLMAWPVNEQAVCVLLIGPSGCGKTSLARMFAGRFADPLWGVRVVDCGSAEVAGGKLAAHDLEWWLWASPMKGRGKALVLEEVHGMSRAVQTGLLNALERLPAHRAVIATTTEPKRLTPAFRSRFHVCRVDAPGGTDVAALLCTIARKRDVTLADAQARIIMRAAAHDPTAVVANYNVRDAVNELEHALVSGLPDPAPARQADVFDITEPKSTALFDRLAAAMR
jgi:replication-associated recombination protein RarA